MRTIMCVLSAALLVAVCGIARAETFPISVTIPQAQGADFFVFELVDGQPFPEDPEVSNNLDFTVTLDSEVQVFFGDQFYAIDVAPQGGSGQLDVLVEYDETSNPNGGAADGLGEKAIATVVRANPDDSEDELEREILYNIDGTTILASQLSGGFMRMYLGLATGDPLNNEPAAAVPFTTGDAPGDYTGTLTLTVTQP